MTQEEKFEEAKRLYETANADQRYVLESLFPELRESEDEIVIAALKSGINGLLKKEYHLKGIGGISFDRINAWLEKQGEKKYIDKIEPKFKAGDKVLVDGKVYTIELVNEDNYIVDENGRDVQEHFSYTKDWKLYEQKPTAWSEEDETALGDALWCCKQAASIAKNENDMGNVWYAEHWLKSLKFQLCWKPSDEQMKALNEAIYHVDDSVATQIAMLIGELSKL